MKKALQCFKVISLVFAFVGLISLLVGPGIIITGAWSKETLNGMTVVFGNSLDINRRESSTVSLFDFVIITIAIITLTANIILGILDKKHTQAYKILDVFPTICFVVSAAMLFFAKIDWINCNSIANQAKANVSLGTGILASSILFIISGILAIVPLVYEVFTAEE